jgi:predicted methyltransferase
MHPTRRQALVAALAIAGAPVPVAVRAQASSDFEAALRAAVGGAHRSAANRARDGARHPLETLRFLGLQPELTVIELAPGGGWYTEILAPVLRERGRLIAAHYARDSADEGRRRSRASFEAKLAYEPALYDRVQVGTLPRSTEFTDPPVDGRADMVLTFRNVHNWLEDGHLDATLAACHRALKPGGVLGVEEHRAAPGTPLETMMKSGYVTEALMEERARAAGFTLAARSEVNANPRDTKDHPNGVWSLPPTLRGAGADQPAERARVLAIGESDRFTHRYVKAARA